MMKLYNEIALALSLYPTKIKIVNNNLYCCGNGNLFINDKLIGTDVISFAVNNGIIYQCKYNYNKKVFYIEYINNEKQRIGMESFDKICDIEVDDTKMIPYYSNTYTIYSFIYFFNGKYESLKNVIYSSSKFAIIKENYKYYLCLIDDKGVHIHNDSLKHPIEYVLFSNTNIVIFDGNNKAYIYDIMGKLTKVLCITTPVGGAISDDGNTVVLCYGTKIIEIWDIVIGIQRTVLSDECVLYANFYKDGLFVVKADGFGSIFSIDRYIPEKLKLLRLARKFCTECPLHQDVFPRDMFKIILKLAIYY
jgi:hypothetical protein